MNENNLKELELNELIDYLNNTNIDDIDLDALLDVKLLEKVSVDDVNADLITALMKDDKMLSDENKAYQISTKTSRGAKILYTLLNGSNHEKIKELLAMKEEAMKSGVAVAFSDNIAVIERSLESIKSQVAAISAGIMSEEARYKAKFLDPMASKINELTTDLVNSEVMQSQCDRLSMENEKLVKDVEKLTLVNEKNEATIVEQKERINELTAESMDIMKANKLMSEKIDDLNKVREKELSDLRDEYEGDLVEKDDTISTLNKRIESLELESSQQLKTEESLREEMKTLKEDKLETENKLKQNILDLSKEKNEAEFKVASVSMEKDKLKNENVSLNSSIDQFKTRQKELEDRVNSLSIDKNSLEVKVQSLEALVSSHNKNIEDKQTSINGLEVDLKKEIQLRQEKEHEIAKLEMIVAELRSKLSEIDSNKVTDESIEGKASKSKK